jgi:hypothetical protein
MTKLRVQAKISELDNTMANLEGENTKLLNTLSTSKTLNYVAIALIAVAIAVLAYQRRTEWTIEP